MPTSHSIFPAFDEGRRGRRNQGDDMGQWKQSNDGFSVIAEDADEPVLGAGNDADQLTGDATITVEGDAAYDPADHNIADVKAYVGDDRARAAAVLELEDARGDKARSSLVTWLEGVGADDEG